SGFQHADDIDGLRHTDPSNSACTLCADCQVATNVPEERGIHDLRFMICDLGPLVCGRAPDTSAGRIINHQS
ncbi:MAG: hypothetical protein MUC88_14935, partial [Planctomycetes bacterium]|nr:hypothetical protein [Planctomycetota bacterium]